MNNIPEIESQSPEKIMEHQLGRLKELMEYVSQHSPYYKELFAAGRIDVRSIKQPEDLAGIPTTTKDEFQRRNWDFLCVPRNKIVEYTSTSGTMGKPVTVALTAHDIQRLAYNECISFACADGTTNDLYQLMVTLDRQFMAGIAYYEGIRKLGAGLVRVGPGLPAMQWETIERLRPTAIVSVPSFIVKLIEFASAQGIDVNTSSVRRAICIGESLRSPDLKLNTLGRKISDAWNIQLYGTYASTEMQTAFTECRHGNGGHHHPDLIYIELLDENDAPVAKATAGEITITTLGVEGMPLVRYKTGDIAIGYEGPCACGRTTLRLGPVLGRKQQMIKLKGTTIYPPGIFDILHQTDHIQDYIVETFTGPLGTDELKLHLVAASSDQEAVQTMLKSVFQSHLRVVPEINFLTAQELERMQLIGQSRKTRKFIDSRN